MGIYWKIEALFWIRNVVLLSLQSWIRAWYLNSHLPPITPNLFPVTPQTPSLNSSSSFHSCPILSLLSTYLHSAPLLLWRLTRVPVASCDAFQLLILSLCCVHFICPFWIHSISPPTCSTLEVDLYGPGSLIPLLVIGFGQWRTQAREAGWRVKRVVRVITVQPLPAKPLNQSSELLQQQSSLMPGSVSCSLFLPL